uniref:PKD-like domain-containing protein n=1 Tax=Tenacibaculum agarivorans TaxID=1908389 RepID=UPI000B3294BF
TSDESEVIVNPLPVFTSITSNSPICEGNDIEFYISGSANSVLTYNLNGNANQTITLDGSGNATITNIGAVVDTTINLVSLSFSSTGCSISLSNSTMVTVNPNPTLSSVVDIIECVETPVQTLNANDGIVLNPNTSITWYDAPAGGNIVTIPTINTENVPTSFYAEITDTSTSCVNPIREEVVLHIVSPPFPNFTERVCSRESLDIAISSFTATYTVTSSDPMNVPAGTDRTTAIAANITDSYVNTSGVPVTITYTVTIDDGTACNGETFDVVVTVDPEPFNAIEPTDIVCSDVALNYDLNGDVNISGATFTWSAMDNPNVSGETISGGVGSTITDTLTNTSGVDQTVVYTIIPTSTDGCVGNPFTYTVTVNPEPFNTIAPIDIVCSDVALNHNLETDVNVSGGSFTWSASDNPNVTGETLIVNNTSIITDTLTNTSGVDQIVVYTITPTSGVGCVGNSYTYTVTVNPEPFNNVPPIITICSNTSLSYDLQSNVNLTGTTFTWSVLDNPNVSGETLITSNTSSITDTLINTSGSIQNVAYTITPTSSDGCIGDPYVLTVRVDPEPFNVVAPTDIICSDITLNHNLASDINVTGTTFSWFATNNPNVIGETTSTTTAENITDTLTNTSGSIQTVVYTITPTSPAGCIGNSFLYTVTVNPEPFNATAPTDIVCSDITLNHDLTTDVNLAGVTFNWVAADNGFVTGETTTVSNSTTITDTLVNISGSVQTVIYTITATSSDGCVGDSFTYTVTVNPEPFNAIAPTDTVCSNIALNHDLSTDVNLSGTTFSWIATDNPNITGETLITTNTSSITDTLINTSGSTQSVIYTINPTSASGCLGEPYTYTVTVESQPVFTSLTSNSPICEGNDVEFYISGSANSVLTYNLDGNANQTITLDGSGNATITNIGAVVDTTINLVSLSFSGTGCSTNLSNSTIATVNPNPTLSSVTDIIECVETPIQTLNANDGIVLNPNTSIIWYDAPAGGNIITSPTINTENVPTSFYAEITDTSTSCVNPIREEVVLHIVSPPFPNFTERVCSSESLDIAISSFTAIYTVTSSDPVNVPAGLDRTTAIAANITDTYVNTSGAPIVVTYTVTINDGTACNGETFDVIVTVDPEPFNPIAPTDIVCSDVALNHDLNGDVNISGTTFIWSAIDNPNVSGETISGSVGSTITDTLTNTSGVDQTVVYTIIPTSAEGCIGNSFAYTVTVNPRPEALPITGNSSVCIGETINLTAGTTGTSVTWFSSDTSVATIDNAGVITGVDFGTVDITYVVTDANGCNSLVSPEYAITVAPSLDTDGDGLTDCEETTGVDDPTTIGVPSGTSDPNDSCSFTGTPTADINNTVWQSSDCDGDGVSNGQELVDGTDPIDPCSFTGNPTVDTSNSVWQGADCDGDGVSNGQEIVDGTDPTDPCSFIGTPMADINNTVWQAADCDGDGVSNGQELVDGTDPTDPCSFTGNPIADTSNLVWQVADCDGDGVSNGQELVDGTDPTDPCSFIGSPTADTSNPIWQGADCDGDGVSNGQELIDGTDPTDPCSFIGSPTADTSNLIWQAADCDGDGVSNGQELIDGTDPTDPCSFIGSPMADTSNPIWQGADCDGDGVSNGQELIDGTDPADPCSFIGTPTADTSNPIWQGADCDGDGVTNGQELIDGTDPTDPCSFIGTPTVDITNSIWQAADCDGDGVSNGQEVIDGTNPTDPCSFIGSPTADISNPIWQGADCDGDGVSNGQEVIDGTDPTDPCSFTGTPTADTSNLIWQAADCDGDGVSNGQEIVDGTDPTDPCSFIGNPMADTSNPIWQAADCDGDGVSNGQELIDGTDPTDPCSFIGNPTADTSNPIWQAADCDGDGVSNGQELIDGTDPTDPCSFIGSPTADMSNPIWQAADCDGDGVSNGQELIDGTDPTDPCSFIGSPTADTSNPIWQAADCDGDGVSNGQEIIDGTDATDPCSYNPDNQIIADVSAVWNTLDCDSDGLSNGDEVIANTDPLNPDSDGDGLTDNEEVNGVDDPSTPLDPTTYVEGPTSDPNDPCDPVEGANCNNDECLNPYNLMSPGNGNSENNIFFIRCIDNPEYANNTVEIFNRWGNTVFKIQGYSNTDSSKRFEGISSGRATINVDEKLPVGTYYYVINPGNGDDPKTGWLYINR